MINDLIKLFKSQNYNLETKNLSPYLLTIRQNQYFIIQNEPVQYVYILLKGSVEIIDESLLNSENNVIDFINNFHILGLVEYLNNIPTYCAFAKTYSDCLFLKFKSDFFVDIIKKDTTLCFLVLRTLSNYTKYSMYRAKSKFLLQQENILGHYFYKQAKLHNLPYIYPYTREHLAYVLSINLRTLYRYLKILEKEDLITIKKAIIIININNFNNLTKKYQNLSFK